VRLRRRQVVDPWGEVVARFEDPLATGVITADVDPALIDRVRAKMPIREHRAAGRRRYLGAE
jgi:predicted amidohydrolase